ncbi:MAG: hypothetical protein DDT26_02016 [Dehalococcoidia bacterium]|nr:hypothetical protein [Chloroflexota bacterium]
MQLSIVAPAPLVATHADVFRDLFENRCRHYNHGEGTYPLAHNPAPSHYVSGAVRFPVDLRLYRRYEEFTHWEAFVQKHFPGREIPIKKKERARFHKEVDPVLLKDPEFEALHQQFQTKITLGIELIRRRPIGALLWRYACLAWARCGWSSDLRPLS